MIRFLQTPGPVKKVVLGGMLLVICAAMVITLMPGGLGSNIGIGGPGQGVLATVAGQEVTTQEVNRAADQRIRQEYPRGGAQAQMLRPFVIPQAAQQLINEKAIIAEAERLGLRATDDEVRDEIQHGRYAAAFFPGGKFIGETEYEGRLQAAGLSVSQFEQGVKDEILFTKLRDMVAGGAAVTDDEVRKEFARRNTKVKLEYAVLDRNDVIKDLHPTEAELRAYYEQRKASYNNSLPEKRKIRYVIFDPNRVQAEVQVTSDEVRSYYDQHREDYRVPEQVNVRHILIKTPAAGADGKVDPKAVDAARKKAEDILKQVKAGGDFAALAKKNSEDPGSAQNGGSLGWVERGRTVPEFENAAFSLPKGGTSDLVQSSYGFHIIRVDDKQPARVKLLDEVKAQIEPILRQQKISNAAEAQANALLAQARSQGLEKAAAAKGMQAITTDFVGRSDVLPGIGSAPRLMDAVFSAGEKAPPDEAPLSQGYAVFEVLAVKPPSTPTFEEIRSQVEAEFRNERGAALLTQKTQELSDRARAAHDLKKAAKELGASIKTSDFVTLDGQVPDIGSMSGPAAVAFGMNPGEISGPISTGTSGVVFSILERQEAPAADFQVKQDEIRDSLVQARQAELFTQFVSNLRQQMEKSGKIKINQQEMKNLTRGPNNEGE